MGSRGKASSQKIKQRCSNCKERQVARTMTSTSHGVLCGQCFRSYQVTVLGVES